MSSKSKKQTSDSEYWEYLEENSRVVSNWPGWMRGENEGQDERKCSSDEEQDK